MLPRRFALLLAVLLLLAGAARIGWTAGHQPLPVYANRFDIGRTSVGAGRPSGPVIIVTGMTRLEPRPGLRPNDSSGAAPARVFPTHRDPASARFERVIDLASFFGVPISGRTYARSRGGIMAEFDRRALARAAR